MHFLKARTSYIQSQRDKNEKDDKQGDISNFIFHNNFLDVSEPLCRSKLRITNPAEDSQPLYLNQLLLFANRLPVHIFMITLLAYRNLLISTTSTAKYYKHRILRI